VHVVRHEGEGCGACAGVAAAAQLGPSPRHDGIARFVPDWTWADRSGKHKEERICDIGLIKKEGRVGSE
jgi:hypothetical protein